MLDAYESGIEITSVNMLSATAPEDVKSSFDDAIKSREDKQRKINEAEAYRNEIVERSQGEAARIRLESEAYKSEVVSRAEGEARRFDELLTAYEKAPEVTRQRLYLETVESVLGNTGKVLMNQGGSNNVTYLPLDRLLERGVARAGATTPPEGEPQASSAVADPDVYSSREDALARLRENNRLRGAR
jgi:membrane protease subunit HflK